MGLNRLAVIVIYLFYKRIYVAGTPLQQGGTWKKRCKSGDPGHVGLIIGKLRNFFMFNWEGDAAGCWNHFWLGLQPLRLP